ncbi:MAG: nuclear transport factor 2 family protein [Bacteroidota bacterium]
MQSMPQHPNTLPDTVTTEIIATDDAGRARAQRILALYELISTNPTLDGIRDYIADDYVQHSPMLPDGPVGVSMFFQAVVAQYPARIDVHRIMVIGDWAMAHVNFRNLNTDDPEDLGMAGVDIYTFGPDGKLTEHWDAVQQVPATSTNPNGMFLKVRG